MDLRAEATRAAQIADALSQFRDSVADDVEELTATIVELNTLSNTLRKSDKLWNDSDDRIIVYVRDDLKLVFKSVVFTFGDIWNILGRIGNGAHNPTQADYRLTWKEISAYCQGQGGQSLAFRLEMYDRFLTQLCAMMRNRRSSSQREIGYLRVDIRELLGTQDRRLIMPPDPPTGLVPIAPLIRPRSYERHPPPSSPTDSRDGNPQEHFPPAPDPPTSPTGTFSTASWSGSSAGTEHSHWAREVFRDINLLPSTPFDVRPDGDISKCIGRVMQSAKDDVNRRYEELFKITFEGGLCVRLYHRERDHGARILCETPERSGNKWYSCLHLDALNFYRNEGTLFLCQTQSRTEARAWAILQFTTIEKLVLFYSTLLSMRSHDGSRPLTNIRDHELKEEDCFFSGEIKDSGYTHALRVYHDRYSKAVRLLASVATGPMKYTPVWTAFVTHQIHSPSWQQRAGHQIVLLRELRRHIFSPRYEPRVAISGEQVLEFTTPEDANDFMTIISQLAYESRPPPPQMMGPVV